jgi:hypothetical protein
VKDDDDKIQLMFGNGGRLMGPVSVAPQTLFMYASNFTHRHARRQIKTSGYGD